MVKGKEQPNLGGIQDADDGEQYVGRVDSVPGLELLWAKMHGVVIGSDAVDLEEPDESSELAESEVSELIEQPRLPNVKKRRSPRLPVGDHMVMSEAGDGKVVPTVKTEVSGKEQRINLESDINDNQYQAVIAILRLSTPLRDTLRTLSPLSNPEDRAHETHSLFVMYYEAKKAGHTNVVYEEWLMSTTLTYLALKKVFIQLNSELVRVAMESRQSLSVKERKSLPKISDILLPLTQAQLELLQPYPNLFELLAIVNRVDKYQNRTLMSLFDEDIFGNGRVPDGYVLLHLT